MSQDTRKCLACGAGPGPNKKLLRCSGCFAAEFCNAECQKAAWPQHRAQCTRCKKFDVVTATPLLAALAFMPRMNRISKMLHYEVFKRELFGRELHLHLRSPGKFRMDNDFDVSHSQEGPSATQLHSMVMHDGYVEAATVGAMYGFHRAIQRYNNRHTMGPPAASRAPEALSRSHDYILPTYRTFKLAEYGIALGSTCPDFKLVYHVDGKVMQLQDPKNHVWMYFRTEKADRMYMDVGSMSYGMALMLNVVGYLPPGTPEHDFLRYVPTGQLGAPACVLDGDQLALMESMHAGAKKNVRSTYLADRERFPISSLSADENPEDAIRRLLQLLRDAAASAPDLQPETPDPQPETPSAAAATSTSSKATTGGPSMLGVVAAAAVVTAAVAKGPSDGSPSASASATASGGSAATAKERPPSAAANGSGRQSAPAAGPPGPAPASVSGPGPSSESGSTGRPYIPFRDGPLIKHVQRAMLHFEAAFNNTYAVLEQGFYKNYPTTIDAARSFARWTPGRLGPDPGGPGARPTTAAYRGYI